jgi:CRISPR-associated helicase Cas3
VELHRKSQQGQLITMATNDFAELFSTLTAEQPFPWQTALYNRFVHRDIPSAANLPTGLGKTSVIAIWLVALITSTLLRQMAARFLSLGFPPR